MKTTQITLPKLGESIVSATVVQWLKNVGDSVSLDDPIVEVSTDKVNSEIPSPYSGILKEILVQVDQEVEVGAPLAIIELVEAVVLAEENRPITQPQITETVSSQKANYYSPAVLNMAHKEGICVTQLASIPATGEGGRLSKKDLENFLSKKMEKLPEEKSKAVSSTGAIEIMKMSNLRKAIAENMARSFHEAPHASLVTEIDVSDLMKLISKDKERFFERHGAKLTITSFLVQALAKTLEKYPMLNSSLDEDTIVMKRYVNVGIAVHIEKGLVVPVIKNCQEKSISKIAKDIAELSQKARMGKLTHEEISEGSFTLTNFGMTGTLIGVPIIRHPEVAILGAGAIQKRVVVREDDSFAVRSMIYVTLTFDHRIIDGVYGCEFLAAFKNYLEALSTLE